MASAYSRVVTISVSVPFSVPGQTCRNFPVLRFLTVPNGMYVIGQIDGSYENFSIPSNLPILAYSSIEKVYFKLKSLK